MPIASSFLRYRGTSWHAGLVAEYMFEEFCRIPVEVEYASEFRYRNPIVREATWLLLFHNPVKLPIHLPLLNWQNQGRWIFGVQRVVGSSIARASHAGSYTRWSGDRGGKYQGIYSTAYCAEHDLFDCCSKRAPSPIRNSMKCWLSLRIFRLKLKNTGSLTTRFVSCLYI